MKTLYLHIGTSKTATTAIQRFFADNRDLLASKGFVYPKVLKVLDVNANRNAHPLFAVITDSNGKRLKNEEEQNRKGVYSQILSCFRTCDNILMSDETAWSATSTSHCDFWEELHNEAARGGYQVKIIVYLRRQDQFAASRWNQRIKSTDSTIKWKRYIKDPNQYHLDWLSYDSKLESIAKYFGKEAIIVRRFQSDCFYGGSIYSDFLHILNLELTSEYILPDSLSNISLSENMAELKRLMNTLHVDMDRQERFFYVNVFRECSRKAPKADTFSMFSREEAFDFLEQFQEGNARVVQDYLQDGKPLFNDAFPERPKWEKDNPYFTDDMIRFFSMLCIELHRENMELRDELHRFHRFRYFLLEKWAKLTGKANS